MELRPLGNSGINVSAYSFGAWQIGDPAYWGADAEKDAASAVDAALDAGINLFDTAEMYGAGESENVLGRLLRGRRDRVLLASKVKPENCAPDTLVAACEASLARLNTDVIDLYQVHWPPRDVPFEAVYGAMERLRQTGKIRAIGVSNFGELDLGTWFENGACVSNQIGYNLMFRAAEYGILPACARHELAVLAYMPLMQGILVCRWKSLDDIPELRRRTRHFAATRSMTRHGEPGCEDALQRLLAKLGTLAEETGQTPAALALAWLAARPGITSVIIGARDARQLQRNLEAGQVVMDAALRGRMDALSDEVRTTMGPNADMWLPKADSRIR